MFNFIERVNWSVLSDTLLKGNPPLIVQLLAVNSIIFIYLIVKRIRRKGPRKASAAHLAQAVLIISNLLLFSQEQLRPFYNQHIGSTFNKVHRSVFG